MLAAGAKVTNPRSGTEFELLDIQDDGFVLRNTMEGPSRAPDFAEHFHVGWHEDFKILSGEGRYRLDGQEGTANAGDTVALPERMKHVHPMSVSPEPMVMEHHAKVTGYGPEAVRDTLGFFFTMFEWDAEGKIALDKLGLPKNPMQFAAAGRVLGKAGGYDARLPKGAADFASATVGRLAEMLGYSVIDPKWR